MNWKPGDIAICINVGNMNANQIGVPPSLRLNSEYMVQNVYTCPSCKRVSLDVGLANQGFNNTLCCTEHIPCIEIHWCLSTRFVKKDLRTKQEQIEEAVSNEDFELAAKLRGQ